MNGLQKLLMEKLKEGKTSEKGSKKQQAKLDVLAEIAELLKGATKGKLEGMKKVTVAAPTTEGLIEGLEKAGEIVEAKTEDTDSDDKGSDLDKLKKIMESKK